MGDMLRRFGYGSLLVALMLCAGGAAAQDIVVSGGFNVRIADGAVVTSIYDGTGFGTVDTLTGSKLMQFHIDNVDPDGTNLQITGPITLVGSADFTINQSSLDPSVGFGRTFFQVTFNPSSDGNKSATITIPNSDPDATEGSFSFTVSGEGSSFVGLAPPNLSVSPVGNTKTLNTPSDAKVKTAVQVVNLGPGDMGTGELRVFVSTDSFLDGGDGLLTTIPLPPMPAPKPGKAPKKKLVRLNLEPPLRSGVLIVQAVPAAFPTDHDGVNNVAMIHF